MGDGGVGSGAGGIAGGGSRRLVVDAAGVHGQSVGATDHGRAEHDVEVVVTKQNRLDVRPAFFDSKACVVEGDAKGSNNFTVSLLPVFVPTDSQDTYEYNSRATKVER